MTRLAQTALVGGNEFRRDCEAMDRALVEQAGGPGIPVAILPTAAAHENPYRAGENGVRHFRRLGAAAEKLMIVDAATANDPRLTTQLERFRLIYFTGGDPAYLLETLRGSRAWEVVLAQHQRGALLAGSSAGAMVLGGQTWRFDAWTPGLGLIPNVAVIPHHATLATRWNAAHRAASLPAGVTLVGIDEATALLLPEGRVLGEGNVTVYGGEGVRVYGGGDSAQVSL
ncbi:MAG: Type 1 glutamine amidotransferase-like domain-containing protein [Anaerolineales bacterium]